MDNAGNYYWSDLLWAYALIWPLPSITPMGQNGDEDEAWGQDLD